MPLNLSASPVELQIKRYSSVFYLYAPIIMVSLHGFVGLYTLIPSAHSSLHSAYSAQGYVFLELQFCFINYILIYFVLILFPSVFLYYNLFYNFTLLITFAFLFAPLSPVILICVSSPLPPPSGISHLTTFSHFSPPPSSYQCIVVAVVPEEAQRAKRCQKHSCCSRELQ